MKKTWLVLSMAFAVASAALGFELKMKAPELKRQAGIVTAYDDASLTLAVKDGDKVAQMSFAVDPLTQFKIDKKSLTGKPAVVAYVEKGGDHVARIVAGPEKPSPKTK